jgi:predicted DNA-binding transcriptional regulator YafY
MRHRDNLGPLGPREVSEQAARVDGWVEQTLQFDTPQVAVAALLALAPQVEVLSPETLRAELAETAMAIVVRNQ